MKDWSIIRRFVIESAVKRYGSTTLADEIFVLHGPCGVGKRTAVKGMVMINCDKSMFHSSKV
jgi:guanylate kinase